MSAGGGADQDYDIVIQSQGQGLDPFGRDSLPMGLNGQFIDPEDGKGSVGTLQGTFQPDRQMIVNYVHRDGSNGTCQLTYAANGQSLLGVCAEKGGGTFKWSGTRVASATTRTPRPNRAELHSVTVKLDVDVFAAPGGNGKAIDSLNAGTKGVMLVEACKGDWCHVRWDDGEGWVYSGSDYNSLGQ